MNSALLLVIIIILYILGFRLYGRFLSKKIFSINPENTTPAHSQYDGKDFVPTRPFVLFGHHFTSIAGVGPIVGPAIAVIWGWVPAVLWIVIGGIFIGAVHDFGALVLSIRNQGRSIGDISRELINRRMRTLFMLLIFFSLTIVLAVFMFVIAILFKMYPASIFPVWMQIPVAIGIGYLMYEKKLPQGLLGISAVILLYILIYISASSGVLSSLEMPDILGLDSTMVWIIILLGYAYIASVLPVHRLLQPRDFINGLQLFIILFLLVLGVLVMHPPFSAPALRTGIADAPRIFPFLFITIACGAVSGFHSLVSSGTTAKQLGNERHALGIGYGAMLIESLLAVLVVIAACAALGSREVWFSRYSTWAAASGLGAKLGAFVEGSVNLLGTLMIPETFAKAFIGVLIVSFAGTTLDSATRIQRYIITELGHDLKVKVLTRPYPATLVAVGFAAILTFMAGGGKGGLLLWPLFGATNQLLGALAFAVITVYLLKRNKPVFMIAVPAAVMIGITSLALVLNCRDFLADIQAGKPGWHLLIISLIIIGIEIWMILEILFTLKNSRKAPPALSLP